MTTKQKQRIMNIDVQITTQNEEIKPIKTEKLLGIQIQDDMKWTEYIQNNDKSLLKQLTSRLNALKMISSIASFQISLWGGTEDYLLQALQVVQNKAARFVARRGKYTPVADLLSQCGWLSVKQLVFYHSVILIHKTMLTACPKYIYSKLSSQFPYNTRLAESDSVRMGPEFMCKLEITEKSFMNRSTVSYNKLPAEIRKLPRIELFKKKLKVWVLENVKI